MSPSRERAGNPDVGLSLKSSPSRAQRLAPPKHVLQMTVHEPLPDQRAKPAGRVSRLKAPRVHAESQRSGSTELFIIDDGGHLFMLSHVEESITAMREFLDRPKVAKKQAA